ncbi:efflux transporter outer membrane subunit [Geomonas azotofigens]|uniref:efflux transporter outer membrane subunit n=1 Tax=Geomonas azotofigens TaxID=2843196 RepID=UPI001C126A82|nr:efflux transporter outer membrane subunit [Geomonas azotofigens]MBU5613911.1 efflux transporter outer membrane subunit [Geomonas azotofigens]
MENGMVRISNISCVAIVAAMALGGCARLPVGVKPEARVVEPASLDAGNAIDGEKKHSVTWPSQQWWKVYADPQLDRLIADATAGNPSMHMARSRITISKSVGGIARSGLMPTVQTEASFTREQFSERYFVPHSYAGNWAWYNEWTTALFYDLDLWGKNRSALAAALDQIQMVTAEAQEVRLSLETAVIRLYVQLSLQYSLLDVARETLHQREQIRDILEKRRSAGLGTEIELRQAETVVPAARADIERISESIEILRNRLSALAGKGPGYGEGIRRPTMSFALPIGLPSSIPADLLGRRPDVVAQRWRVEASGKGINVAKASFYPNINLTAFAGWQSLGFDKFLSSQSVIKGFTPAISLPIFEGGRLREQLRVSTAQYDLAVDAYNNTLIHALEEVANEVVTLRSLEKQRTETYLSYSLAGRAYDIALAGFKAGLSDYLTVLNAQSQTLVESQRKAQVEAHFLDAYAALMRAIGGGVPVNAPPGTPGADK